MINFKSFSTNERPLRNFFAIFALFAFSFLMASEGRSSTTMQFDVGIMSRSGTEISAGTLAFLSLGSDGVFNSSPDALGLNATSLVAGDDIWMYATGIIAGASGGLWIEDYTGGVAANQKIMAVFFNNLTTSQIDYSSGTFLGGLKIGTGVGSTSYQFGTYRNDLADTLGGNASDAIAWIVPIDAGATASISAYSNTGLYVGGDITAVLTASSNFAVIPEPSSMSLLIMGLASALAFRRKRASLHGES